MKTKPYAHQLACLERSWSEIAFAIFLEQGLGKTKIALDTAAALYRGGLVNGLFVVAPNGVHSNWARREIPAHLSDECGATVAEWSAKACRSTRFESAWQKLLVCRGLAVFCLNVEGLSSGAAGPAAAHARAFLSRRRSIMVVDESSRIKTPSSRRTKQVIALGRHAAYRRIMTGTPVTQTPFDLYSQFGFLDPSILGFTSFYSFRHQYGVFEKRVARGATGNLWRYENLARYVRLEDLRRRVEPHLYRRTKDECLDIPDKIYQRIPVEMSAEQARLYRLMEEDGAIEIPDEGFEVLAPLQIVRLMRCQQILGGFSPTATVEGVTKVVPLSGPNPKLERLVELAVEDYPGKTIVWARFRAEIDAIVTRFRREFGDGSVVEFHGGVNKDARVGAVDAFQDPKGPRFLVGQQASGIGVTLTAAQQVFYYSNSFSYEQRYQSEDRSHRIGLRHPVVYVDLEVAGTIDERIRDVLKASGERADAVTGDSERRRRCET